MKQVFQSLRTGQTTVMEVPCPAVTRGHVLIRSRCSLLSSGTERMLLDFGRAGWIDKARQQPDKVRQTLEKIKTDGIGPTLDAVFNKLDQPLALGNCNVGVVLEERDAPGFSTGDRVASNGKHAEVVSVPKNLCARIPDSVSDEEAAFTVIAAIALQGIRLVAPTLGESVVVTGLGLIGLLTVQLLRANGCRVLGSDLDPVRLELGRQFGADVIDLSAGESPIEAAHAWSRGRGVDAVLITASTTSSEPVHQAAQMCRKRGRIVLVGVTGLELSRADFYEKELSFQVSCSYGPGRYDAHYETKGQDYPIAFVRWTEQRNFEAVLDMMADKRLNVRPLISRRFSLDQAPAAYELLGSNSPSLGILLDYQEPHEGIVAPASTVRLTAERIDTARDLSTAVSFIGAGDYSNGVLIPAFKAAGGRLRAVASLNGATGAHAARKFGFSEVTTDVERVLGDDGANIVAIATRHDSHARLVCQALAAGKHVFVEKPLALTLAELIEVELAYRSATKAPLLMVGFNRRFSPQIRRVKALLEKRQEPKAFVMTVNAGRIAPDHWTQDSEVGGGRIIGEACHFTDLLRFLAGAPITSHDTAVMRSGPIADCTMMQLAFADGSIGTIHYLTNGHRSYPKERLEVFCGGGILRLDNFRKLVGYGWSGFGRMNLWRQDKGQRACVKAFLDAVRTGGPSPIAFEELLEVSRTTIAMAHASQP